MSTLSLLFVSKPFPIFIFSVLEAITFLIVCIILFLIGIPTIYMATKRYLQQLLCCGSHAHGDYENIKGDSFHSDLSDSFDTFDDIFNPPPETPPKEAPTFTFESHGYYYSRQAQLGSKFTLLGMVPDNEATKGKITTDLSYSFLQEKPGLQVNISNLTFLDQPDHTTTDKSMYKFKIKIVNHYSINPDDPLNTVCHLESDFIPYHDIQKHLFKIYSYDATEIFENLELKLRVYYKRTVNSERFYLGDGKLKLAHKDDNGNVVKEKMTLRKDWRRQISA